MIEVTAGGGGGSPRRRAAERGARTDARRWGGRGNSRGGSCGGSAVEGKRMGGMGVDNRILFALPLPLPLCCLVQVLGASLPCLVLRALGVGSNGARRS